jgi:hypothetical protein
MILIPALVLLAAAGCDDDPAQPRRIPTPSPYNDLTEKWHVMSNLERAYDERNVARYAEIFDQDHFVFHFNPGDVGGDVPEYWGYTEEINSATNMFTGGGGHNDNPILSIDLTLMDIESATWTDVEDARFPGETLWQATVQYSYYMDTEADIQYITSGAPKAQLIVRQVDGKWKLVTWYDLEGTYQMQTAAATQESTWSKVKALYSGK